jgi:hypothetical protein
MAKIRNPKDYDLFCAPLGSVLAAREESEEVDDEVAEAATAPGVFVISGSAEDTEAQKEAEAADEAREASSAAVRATQTRGAKAVEVNNPPLVETS